MAGIRCPRARAKTGSTMNTVFVKTREKWFLLNNIDVSMKSMFIVIDIAKVDDEVTLSRSKVIRSEKAGKISNVFPVRLIST